MLSRFAPAELEEVGGSMSGRGRFEMGVQGEEGEWGDPQFALKYRCGFVFSKTSLGGSRTAGFTETDLLVPRPPDREYENKEALHTIEEHP